MFLRLFAFFVLLALAIAPRMLLADDFADPSMGGLVQTSAPIVVASGDAEVLPQLPHSALSTFLTALLPILLILLAWLGKRADSWIKARAENELLEGFLVQLNDLAFTKVKALMQTTVPAYQKRAADGKLSQADAQIIKDEAINAVMGGLGDAGRAKAAKLGIVGNTLLDVVGTRIEAAVHDVKLERALVPKFIETIAGETVPASER